MAERRRSHRKPDGANRPKDRPQDSRKNADRRKDERVAAEIMVEVETSGKRTYRRTANFGIGGIGFHAPIPFRLGSMISLSLRLVGLAKLVQVKGEVVGIDDVGRGTRVRFVDLTPQAQAALEEHLELFKAPTLVGTADDLLEETNVENRVQVREAILVVEGGAYAEFRLRSADKVIGRDAQQVDFVIDDASVSRRHAHVYMQNGRHVVTDLSSTNGIHFCGKPIHSLVLNDGLHFRIGKVKLQYLVTKKISRKFQ